MMNGNNGVLWGGYCLIAFLVGCGEESTPIVDNGRWAPPPQERRSPEPIDRSAFGQLIISEFMAVNDSTLTDSEGQFNDWIEIRNYGEVEVDLEGWALTDDNNDLTKWRFPQMSLAPDSFLVVFASGGENEGVGELHCSFQLRGDGEYLALVAPQGRVVHEFAPRFPKQRTDISYGIAPEWNGDQTIFDFEGYLVAPTPGKSNQGILIGQVEPVEFDLEGGVCDVGQSLNLSCRTQDADIFFTLDGSIPTRESGTAYQGAIALDRDRVVRARAFKDRYQTSRVKTRSYFLRGAAVSAERPDVAQFQLPIVSLALDPGEFDAVYKGDGSNGRDWERKVNVEWLDLEGASQDRVIGGLRVQKRDVPDPGLAKHSFRLYFRDEYGPARWRADLFGPGSAPEANRLELRAVARPSLGTVVWNRVYQELTGSVAEPFVRGQFCHLYINARYWGLYELTERPDLDFIAQYFGGKKSSFDVMAGVPRDDMGDGGEWFELVEGEEAAWASIRAGIAGGKPGIELPIERDNLIRFMLLRGLLTGSAVQAPTEWWAIRNREREEGFRWMWPNPLPLLGDEGERSQRWWGETGLDQIWGYLIQDQEFRLAVRDQVDQWSREGGLLDPDYVATRVAEYCERLDGAVAVDRQRWPGSDGAASSELTGWVQQRVDGLRQSLSQLGFVHQLPAAEWRVETDAAGGRTEIYLSSPATEVVYTLDGRDPRAVGGKVISSSFIYRGRISVAEPTVVTVRTKNGSSWGPKGQRQVGMEPQAL